MQESKRTKNMYTLKLTQTSNSHIQSICDFIFFSIQRHNVFNRCQWNHVVDTIADWKSKTQSAHNDNSKSAYIMITWARKRAQFKCFADEIIHNKCNFVFGIYIVDCIWDCLQIYSNWKWNDQNNINFDNRLSNVLSREGKH